VSDSASCWEKMVSELRVRAVQGETPAEKKPFTARLEDSGIAIYLDETRWRVVSRKDFDDYFNWFDYCRRHNFDRNSRLEMKRKIKDEAESSSYVFALVQQFCKV